MSSLSTESQNRRYHDDGTTEQSSQKDIEGIIARNTTEMTAGREGPLQLRKTDDRTQVLADIAAHYEDQIGDPTELPEETPMTFGDLSTLLAPQGVDLKKELDDHITYMVNGGALPESEVDAYKQQFSTIHVRAEELKKIPKGYRPLLFLDNVTPAQAAEKFITTPGINLFEYSTLANFKSINPHTRKSRKNQTPSGHARLTFTPNVTNLTSDFTGESANHHIEQMTKSARYLQPQQWFQLFSEGLQRAIKELNLGDKPWKDLNNEEKQAILNNTAIDPYLPDSTTWTQCPEWRNVNGHVLGLRWAPDDRWVEVDYALPDDAHSNLGARPALG